MARKITTEAIAAFMSGKKYSNSNTRVIVENDTNQLYLYSHLIAKKENGKISIRNADHFTPTTKDRLNGIPGVNISAKKGTWYLNGKEWDGQWINI